MTNLYDRGMHYFSVHDYESAENCFLDALRDGCNKEVCLFNYSVSVFYRTTYQMKGTGIMGGMSRRGDLVMAQKSLREAYDINPANVESIRYLALCSYTLGKLIGSGDGYTVDFYKYQDMLKDLDFHMYEELADDIEGIDSQFKG